MKKGMLLLSTLLALVQSAYAEPFVWRCSEGGKENRVYTDVPTTSAVKHCERLNLERTPYNQITEESFARFRDPLYFERATADGPDRSPVQRPNRAKLRDPKRDPRPSSSAH